MKEYRLKISTLLDCSAQYDLVEEREASSPGYHKICCFHSLTIHYLDSYIAGNFIPLILEYLARKLSASFYFVNNTQLLKQKNCRTPLLLEENKLYKVSLLKLIWLRHAEVYLPDDTYHFYPDNEISAFWKTRNFRAGFLPSCLPATHYNEYVFDKLGTCHIIAN